METLATKLLHLPPSVSEHGPAIDSLLLYIHILMVVLFVGWGIFFAYTMVRFRQSRHPKADHVGVKSHFSTYLEGIVVVVEAVLLFAVAVPLWARAASANNYQNEKDAVMVRVIGRQFNWLAHYPGPDGVFGKGAPKFLSPTNPLGRDPEDPNGKDDVIAEGSEVVLPVDKAAIVNVSSLDVIHNFTVKPLRVCMDAIPGMRLPTWFKPTVKGTYQITCAQLCGSGHSGMRGIVRVVEQKDFEAWLASKSKPGAANAGSYE